MPISRIALRTRGWFVRNRILRDPAALATAVSLAVAACSSKDSGSAAPDTGQAITNTAAAPATLPDSLAAICPDSGSRGSVQVAWPDSTEAETGIGFRLLGDGAGPGVVLCRSVIYADGDTLLSLMGEPGSVSERNGFAVIDSTVTQIPAYRHRGVPYVAVRPFARHRRAVYLESGQPMDAIVWPREALRHLKAAGLTQGRAYQTAVREGLVPK